MHCTNLHTCNIHPTHVTCGFIYIWKATAGYALQELRVVEFFAGQGNVWRTCRVSSAPSLGVDVTYHAPPDGQQNAFDILSSAQVQEWGTPLSWKLLAAFLTFECFVWIWFSWTLKDVCSTCTQSFERCLLEVGYSFDSMLQGRRLYNNLGYGVF